MKARSVVLSLGILAVAGIGGYTAWKSYWLRAYFASDSFNPTEVARASNATLKNEVPTEAASGSPRWRGAAGKGIAPAGSFRIDWEKSPPKELWRVPIGPGFGTCSVVGGKLYVQDRQGDKDRIVCLDVENGKAVWEYVYEARPAGSDPSFANGPRATPSIVGNWVYAVSGDGQILALEVNGDKVTRRWHHDMLPEFGAEMPQWGVACSPLVLNDMVIVQPGGKNAAVIAFDKTTGEVKWKTGSNPPSYSSPVAAPIGGQETVFAFMGDALLAIRPTDGHIMSSYTWLTQFAGNIATPIIVEDYVFISSSYGMGCALLRAEKSGDEVKLVKVYERRGNRAFQNHHATSVYKDRHLFGIDGQTGNAGLKCVAFEKGEEVKDWDGSELRQASLLLAGEHIIVQTALGDLCLVEANPKEFNLLARIPKVLSGKNNWASPTLVDGRIYLRDEKNVVCLDVKP